MSKVTSAGDRALLTSQLMELVGAWWYNYDEWNDRALRDLATEDIEFVSRTSSGDTDYEDFVTIDVTGIDAAMAWQEEHRMASPYPLRHNAANIHITAVDGGKVEFASYIFVTKIVDGRPLSLSSGTACGAARITGQGMLLQRLVVVLDTADSVSLAERAALTPPA